MVVVFHRSPYDSTTPPHPTEPLHYRLGKIDIPLPLNRRPPAIVYAGTALPISCHIIVSLFFDNTSHENVYQQLRRLGTIRRFPAPSSRHDGLEGGRYSLWRGFVPFRGGQRVGEICVGDDELGFEVETGDEPTQVEREKRREVQKW